jgi:hypothetical protein
VNKGKNMKKTNQTPPNRKDSRELMIEDLERWRGESPAAGQVAAAKQEAQQTSEKNGEQTMKQEMASRSSRDLPRHRNSPDQTTPDVTAQNWSAEKLAQESVYEDEAQMKAQIKLGKKVRAANAR